MQFRRFVIIISIILLIIILCWLLWPTSDATQTTQVERVHGLITQTKPVHKSKDAVLPNNSEPSQQISGQQAINRQSGLDEHQVTEIGKSMNRSMDFYAKIIDQHGDPVSGITADIEYNAFGSILNPGLGPDHRKVQRISDAKGEFSFTGENGLNMVVRLHPAGGYEFYRDGFLMHEYRDQDVEHPARIISTPEKPYIFHAWKLMGAASLIKGSIKSYDIQPDGRDYIVDLQKNRIVEGTVGGDFRLHITRPPGDGMPNPFNWSVVIIGITGSLLQTNDPFLYEAPENGYQSSWQFTVEASNDKFVSDIQPKFYYRSQNGNIFGRLEMRIKPDFRSKSAIFIDYYLNPSGSRNLEYSYETRIINRH